MVEQVSYKLPNQMSYAELVAAGKTDEEADRIMHERVFGVGYKLDENGKPIEQGKGGPLQVTAQHVEALRVADERRKASRPVDIASIIEAIGKSQTQMSPELIAAAVAAGVKAAMASSREEVADL